MAIADELSWLGVHAMRASLFKPRTKPGFEGVGYDQGGDWFAEVARTHELAVATEVTSGNDVDMLVNKLAAISKPTQLVVWLGSRMQVHTLQQDVGRALRNAPDNTLLMIKNQPWGDQNHWEGIVDHVAAGSQFSAEEMQQRVALCHRGFMPYGMPNPENWRNVPDLEMAMRVKARTGLKMTLDPSHIAGSRENVFKIVEQAVQDPNMSFDGFIVEVHANPNAALTDAKQQLSIAEFKRLLEEIDHVRA